MYYEINAFLQENGIQNPNQADVKKIAKSLSFSPKDVEMALNNFRRLGFFQESNLNGPSKVEV